MVGIDAVRPSQPPPICRPSQASHGRIRLGAPVLQHCALAWQSGAAGASQRGSLAASLTCFGRSKVVATSTSVALLGAHCLVGISVLTAWRTTDMSTCAELWCGSAERRQLLRRLSLGQRVNVSKIHQLQLCTHAHVICSACCADKTGDCC